MLLLFVVFFGGGKKLLPTDQPFLLSVVLWQLRIGGRTVLDCRHKPYSLPTFNIGLPMCMLVFMPRTYDEDKIYIHYNLVDGVLRI